MPVKKKNNKKPIIQKIVKTENKNNKPNGDKNKATKPMILLLILSLIIVSLLPYIKENQKYIDTDIALSTLETKYSE